MSMSQILPQSETLPHRRMEAWKWTDVRAALAKKVPDCKAQLAPLAVPAGAVVLEFIDGELHGNPDLPDGASISREGNTNYDKALPMARLASASTHDHYCLNIGRSLNTSLCLRFVGRGAASLEILLKAGHFATVIEDHRTEDNFSNTALAYDVGEAASLTRLVHQNGGAAAVQVVTALIKMQEKAKLNQFAIAFGARLSRLETHISYAGEEAKSCLNGAYLLDEERHCDQTFHVTHGVEHCITRQLVRGVVKDHARGVFQGKFYVGRAGQHTDAEMAHDALLLNTGASVFAKPELEIYADDVACAHGNTAGALDENALFYMRQRGLDEAQAKTLLLRAFLGTAFDELDDEALHTMMLMPITDWLEAAL